MIILLVEIFFFKYINLFIKKEKKEKKKHIKKKIEWHIHFTYK